MDSINVATLPYEIRTKLAKLDLELYEGDITEKGYLKRKRCILDPYLDNKLPTPEITLENVKDQSVVTNATAEDPQHLSSHRRFTRDESRYRSDIREEAVKEALARMREEARICQALAPSRRESQHRGRPTPAVPPPPGQPGTASHFELNAHFDSDSAAEEDGPPTPDAAGTDGGPFNLPRPQAAVSIHSNRQSRGRGLVSVSSNTTTTTPQPQPGSQSLHPSAVGLPSSMNKIAMLDEDDVYNEPPPDVITQLPPRTAGDASDDEIQIQEKVPESTAGNTAILSKNGHPVDSPPQIRQPSPEIYANSGVDVEVIQQENGHTDRTGTNMSDSTDATSSSLVLHSRSHSPSHNEEIAVSGPSVVSGRVSEKIQRLMQTLQRPKRRPLSEYFVDDKDALIPVPTLDPSAPRPHGDFMQPLMMPEENASGPVLDFASALAHFSSATGKAPFLTCLDYFSKPTLQLTFAKLHHRALRISHTLLHKLGHRGEKSLRPRDRVALVFPNNDPLSFACAFYGCVLAGLVPVPIEVPLHDGDTSNQAMGFLLSGAGVRVALTNDQCYKALPRNGSTSEVSPLPGWPVDLLWLNVEHHQNGVKTPKNWAPQDTRAPQDTLYIEYSYGSDGCVRGVSVSAQAALEHSRALSKAVNYASSDVMVCVVDGKRETGLWHAILTSLLHGMHVIFVPYVVMKSDPSSWLRVVQKYKATVALVKSRDMHWAMLASRDQHNLSLESLRMLLVADGANPWSVATCDTFVTQFRPQGLRDDVLCSQASSSECLTVALRRPVLLPPPVASASSQSPTALSRANILRQSQTRLRGPSRGSSRSNVSVPTQSAPPPVSTVRLDVSRAVLSMHNLSFGVVRVEAENSFNSLSLQDSGSLLPGAVAVIVKPFGEPHLCRTDEVGEICIASRCTGSGYWGLEGFTNSHFKVTPLKENGEVAFPSLYFVRSRLLGFVGPSASGSSVVFVCGSMDGLIVSACRRHNADDLISTVLAVEPMQLVYRGRASVFALQLLKDSRIVVVAELRPGFTSETIYKWIARVNQALECIHKVVSYAVALVPHNSLPKTPLGGINVFEIRRRFEQGTLHPIHLLLSPHSAITNLPQASGVSSSGTSATAANPTLASLMSTSSIASVSPSAMLVGSLVQGARLAVAEGPTLASTTRTRHEAAQFQYLPEVLQWRAQNSPEERLYTLFNHKCQEVSHLTCQQLHRRAEAIASMLLEKVKLCHGAHVVLLYYPGVEIVSAVMGCLYAGCVPVPVKAPQRSTTATSAWCESLEVGLNWIRQIAATCHAAALLTSTAFVKLLKAKEIQKNFPWGGWPIVLDTEDSSFMRSKRSLPNGIFHWHSDQEVAYVDFSLSSSGSLHGSRYSHAAVLSMCQAQKMQCELYVGREVLLAMDPYGGVAFVLWCLAPVFCGHHCLLVPHADTALAPAAWLTLVSQRRARDVYCSYLSMELASKHLSKETTALKNRGLKLSDLRSLVIVAEERPRMISINQFCKLFSRLGLNPGVVSTSFGCAVNPAIALRGASHPEATTLYIDKVALRYDRVRLVERGSPNSLALLESGTLLPGVRVVIAHPETLGHLAESQLGEICISSSHTCRAVCGPVDASSGEQRPLRRDSDAVNSRRTSATTTSNLPSSPAAWSTTGSEHGTGKLQVQLQSGDTNTRYTRTGYLGFVRRMEPYPGAVHDALFVVEELEESFILRGLRFYPVDLENTVLRAHTAVADCAVFTWSSLVVAVVELDGVESDALDAVLAVTRVLLEEHHLIVGVVVVVDVATIPHNATGKKMRLLLRDTFVRDRLDPIYVAYNM